MKITKNCKVALSYVLHVEGEECDRAESTNPLVFFYGHGQLLPAFEEQIEGLQVGENFEFNLSPVQGYGVHNEQNVIKLPLDLFIIDGELQEDLLKIGAKVPMQTRTGATIVGRVMNVEEQEVTMDFNHELAGKELHFIGRIEQVEQATEEELQQLAHQGCHGGCCDGHSDDCSDGCCGGC